MMSFFNYCGLRTLLLIGLSTLISCSSQQSTLFHAEPLTPGLVQYWGTQLAKGPGRIEIRFRLQPHSSVNMTFSDPAHDNFYSSKIHLNDINCVGGHNVSATFRNQENEIYSFYFTKVAPWNSTSTLVLSWDYNNHLVANLNGENIELDPYKKLRIFSITSNQTPIDLQYISYTQNGPRN
jgi:hypothetical protein